MKPGHGNKLTRKWEGAIAALLAEDTVTAAAVACKVSERALRGWLALPEFVTCYRQARRRVFESAIGRLQGAAAKAVRKLESLLECGTAAVECRAAETILNRAAAGVELLEVVGRIEELERLLGEVQGESDKGNPTARCLAKPYPGNSSRNGHVG